MLFVVLPTDSADKVKGLAPPPLLPAPTQATSGRPHSAKTEVCWGKYRLHDRHPPLRAGHWKRGPSLLPPDRSTSPVSSGAQPKTHSSKARAPASRTISVLQPVCCRKTTRSFPSLPAEPHLP